eukprot:CAMPEP_0172314276 /NCGR_PEP_ID=MMETSP1058-20130122/22132_1 /TAXON_ID=83371 /ORGANISM="Detonula confervacea, Strain CCMP 353" /LENGTH=444 /DNA_ID=CAMNT_0013028099 /DNA_START=18 /DNA_END=1349 /DNA_ORIENTATION=-
MKSTTSLLLAVASTTPSLFIANAQEQTITKCDTENISTCATTANRTCYNYEELGTHECGNCLADYFEYKDDCYAIDDIGTDRFLLLSELLDLFLPDYVDDDTISTETRALRLIAATRIISYWDSQVPPVEFKLGLNMETFLTEEEWIGRLGVSPDVGYETDGVKGEMERFEFEGRKLEDAPPAVDWDAEGYTTSVKNQGLCGCCWAVSVVAAVESALMITNQTSRTDPLDKNSLSWQQLISCDDKDSGCDGGNILQATRYVWEHDNFQNGNFGGIVSYADYPYTDRMGKTTTECQADSKSFTPAAYLNFPKIVNSVSDRSSFEERRDRLKAAVAKQPVTSVLKSGCTLLMNYEEGVLTHDTGCECGESSCIDHAIVITGYDTTASTPYWKLRNSWGANWGEEGYFRIAMNDQGQGWGLFGMLAEAALPSEAYTNLEDLPERPGW